MACLTTLACQAPPDDEPGRRSPADSRPTEAARDPGLVTVESTLGFDETFERLRAAIEANQNLRILATVDHTANARGAGLELPPTRLILFGNPSLGTPLMQSARTTAIDLPQKLLVWEDAAGQVSVTYNHPAYLKRRHGIEGRDEILSTIETALSTLASSATQ